MNSHSGGSSGARALAIYVMISLARWSAEDECLVASVACATCHRKFDEELIEAAGKLLSDIPLVCLKCDNDGALNRRVNLAMGPLLGSI